MIPHGGVRGEAYGLADATFPARKEMGVNEGNNNQ